jgi:hypothetical protein
MPTFKAAPGITRFEIANRKGFMVRISRRGKRVNEYFSDSVYGGKRKALDCAKRRYAQLLEKMGPIPKSTENKITSRNSSGAVGVHVAVSESWKWPNCKTLSYCASWCNEDGSRGKIAFAWGKYGKRNAFELACLARRLKSNDREMVVERYTKRKARAKAANAKRANAAQGK